MILGVFGLPQLILLVLIIGIPVGIIFLVISRTKHKAKAEAYKEMLDEKFQKK